MALIKFPPLVQGDHIGLVAPSLPVLNGQVAAYEYGKRILTDWGFVLEEGETLRKRHWWSAGTREEIAADIHAMFQDPNIKGIVTVNGGFSAIGVLDLLDYELIKANPKPFIGLSDITAYQWGMLTQAGLIPIHGNTLAEGFGEFLESATPEQQSAVREIYLRLLTSTEPLGLLPQIDERSCWRPGRAVGPMIGGNLRRFAGLLGTPYFPNSDLLKDGILLIEDIGETLYDISLNLHRLRHAGVLDQISGLLVGRFTWINQFFEELDHPTLREAILEVCHPYDFPILHSEEFGHRCTMLPLPLGATCRIDAEALSIEVIESVTDLRISR